MKEFVMLGKDKIFLEKGTLDLREGGFENLDEIKGLTDLKTIKKLNLKYNYLENLPESICNLHSLEKLDVSCNELKSLPDSIGNLTSLKILYIQNNKIQELPDSIKALKNLKEILLFNNKLKQVPDFVKKLEKDFYTSETNRIKKAIKKYGISSFSDQIMTRIKKKIKIRIKPTSEDEIKIGESKIGGRPDLPKGVKWPKFDGFPLLFLMQINLSELKELQSNQFTKDKGILFFFYDDYSTGWSLEEKKCVKVIYSGDLEKLVRTDFPKKKIKASNYFNNKLSFDSHKIIFSEAISLPPANGWWYGGYYDNNYIYQEPDLLKDKNFNNFLDNKTDAHDFQISLFGYPSYFGCDAHQLGCLLFSNKRDPFEFEHKADRGMTDEEIKELEALEKKAGEWTLLLQVCSDDDLNGYDVGWQWGDAGILYFWIREEDLKQNNFNNLRVFLEQH